MATAGPPERDDEDGPPPPRIRLFGALDIWGQDGRHVPVASARARSLLTYLVLRPGVHHSRQRLAFLLWPDSGEAQARTNLRNVLHLLRQGAPELEGLLDVTASTLCWRSDAPCWVDTAAFTAAVAEGEAATEGSDEQLAALRAAVELYAGDLVEDSYDDWLVEDRERLRDQLVATLRRLTEVLVDRGEHVEAVRAGRGLTRRDPLNESHHRLLIEVHAAAGDRAGAVRAYHECAAILESELGVEPSAATRDAYARVVTPAAPLPVEIDEPMRGSGAPLVGRDPEWDRLRGCWHEAEAGRAQLVVVTGEPGVGKTRLVEELASWCSHRGVVVARARSYPTEGELGYGLVVSWLRTSELAAALARASAADRAGLARLLPELSDVAGTVPSGLDEAERRRRLFEAVFRALTAPGRPVLLVADDAQWCDASSLQLLHYLVRQEPEVPMLVVATARREELDAGHPLASLVRSLRVDERVEELALGRLGPMATGELAGRLAGRSFDAGAVDHLHAETEGNPLFIVETIRAGWDGSVTGPGLADGRPRSPKLQAIIDARLQRLSAPSRDLLAVAATIGRSFTVELLGAAAGVDEADLVSGLDELWRRGVLREHDTDAYDFTHGKIREVAYEGLGMAARRRGHLLVAEALQAVHSGRVDSVSGQVAANYDRAGRIDEAVAWYQRAAAGAQRRQAHAEAVQLLERAQTLVAALPEGTDRLRQELGVLTALPTPIGYVDGYTSSRLTEIQHRGIEVAGFLDVDPPPPLLRSLSLSHLSRDDFDGAGEFAARLRSAAVRLDDHVLLVESDYLLGVAALWDARLEQARRHFEEVVATFKAEERAEFLVRFAQDPLSVCLSRLGNTLWFLGHDDQAVRARDTAVATAAEVGHQFSRCLVWLFSAVLSLDRHDIAGFRRDVAAFDAEPHRPAPFEYPLAGFVALLDVLDGRPAEGISAIRGVIDRHALEPQAPGLSGILTRLLVAAHDAAGDARGGLQATDDALRIAGTRLWEAEIRCRRATFLGELGHDAAEVDAELTRAEGVARSQGAPGMARRVEQTRSRLRPHG